MKHDSVRLFVVAVRGSGGGPFSFLVEDRPPEEWGGTLRRASGSEFECSEVEDSVVAEIPTPHGEFLDLCAFQYGRGILRGLGVENWDFVPVSILRRSVGAAHYERHEVALGDIGRFVGLIQRESIDEDNPVGYVLAAIRVLGEAHGKIGFSVNA